MRRTVAGTALLLAALAAAAQEPAPGPAVELRLEPRRATIGDPLALTLTLKLPKGTRAPGEDPGPELGPFSVLDGRWLDPAPDAEPGTVVWQGRVAAYRTGELELPPVTLRVESDAGARVVRTEPVAVTIDSVLPPADGGGEPPDLADLKQPVGLDPDYGPLRTALAVVAALLALSLLVWWLVRRFGARLAAAPAPVDPFHRVPPHEWVYGELQRLLDERLVETGREDEFHARLAWIVKRYLGGRYRLDLLERTTVEVPDLLRQGGAPRGPVGTVRLLLERCDQVKFAGRRPGPDAAREAVEEVYRIVDATRPAEPAQPQGEQRGAA